MSSPTLLKGSHLLEKANASIYKALSPMFSQFNFLSLYLVGSYGRSEGLYCEENGKVRFVNDLDYLILYIWPFSSRVKALKKMCMQVSERVQEEYGVDVSLYPVNVCKIIFGRKQLLFFDSFSFPFPLKESFLCGLFVKVYPLVCKPQRRESIRLVVNRLFGCLVEVYDLFVFEKKRNISIGKMYLAIISMHLIDKGQYSPRVSKWPKGVVEEIDGFEPRVLERAIRERLFRIKKEDVEKNLDDYAEVMNVSIRLLRKTFNAREIEKSLLPSNFLVRLTKKVFLKDKNVRSEYYNSFVFILEKFVERPSRETLLKYKNQYLSLQKNWENIF